MKNMFKSDKFRHGSLAVLFTIIFIVLIIVVNVVVSSLGERFPSMDIDLTTGKLNSLSEDAINTAKDVSSATTIYLIGSEEAVRGDQVYSSYAQYGVKYSQVANLTDKLKEANSLIDVKYVDPDMDPTFISKYTDINLTTGMVLVESTKRHKVLTVSDMFSIQQDQTTGETKSYSKVDGALANAIHLTNLDTVPVVAVVSGHSEMLSTDARSAFDKLLEDNSFEVKEVNLLTEEIPEDAQLIMIATPTTDYTKDEIAKLSEFLGDKTKTSSRSVLVTSHPTQSEMPNLAAFLEDWGLKVGTGVVVESDSSKSISSNPSYFYGTAESTVLTGTYSNLLVPYSSPIELTFDTNDSITTYPLIKTDDTCYVSTDGETKENPDTASQITAAMAQKIIQVDSSVYKANVIVLGNSVSLLNDFLGGNTFGNRQYMTDLVKYATDTTETSLGLTVSTTETNTVDITATSGVIFFVGLILFTVLVPLAILAVGIIIYLRRRHL